MRFTFSSFTNPVITAVKGSQRRSDTAVGTVSEGGTVEVTMNFSGTITVGSRKAPFEGLAHMSFMQGTPCFSMRAEFAFPGKELGLLGSKGEGISGVLYTTSVSVLSTGGPGKGAGFTGDSISDEGREIKEDFKPVE